MKNKGFTLIELLAVIVILAIIALIATPIILNIIEDSRTSAKERSAELVVANVKTAYSTAYAKSYADGTKAGQTPKLSEVVGEVQMSNITLGEDGETINTSDGVACSVAMDSSTNYLTVTCYKDGDVENGDSDNIYSTSTTQITTDAKLSLTAE